MRHFVFNALRGAAVVLSVSGGAQVALAQEATPQHGIAMYGEPALPPDFVSLPYANPDAPKGGTIIFGESGGFDSLNPFIVNGIAPAGITGYTIETLMGRSIDEPFTLYGLLAQSIRTDEARSFVEFTLNPAARFSDGTPVTVADVIWSFETLGTLGQPRYATAWKKVAKTEQTGERSVKFTFNQSDRELPLILGLRPVLEKAQWEGKDFTVSSLDPIIGSGPYVVDKVDAGKSISYKRNPDWWGKDLPFNRGLYNLDTVRYEYFGDAGVVFEAFKAGDITSWRETNPVKWEQNYGFAAVTEGKIVKETIPHERPSGIEGFVFNTRKPMFADWRVREALTYAFNFELVNKTLNGGIPPRITSYFGNSTLGMTPGAPAEGRVAELLAPFKDQLLPGALEGYSLPVSDGTEANRKNVRAASKLLEEAGWSVQDGVLKNATGAPFAFDILLTNGADDIINAATIYVEALKRLGIAATVTTVDSAQYKERTTNYDFDMTYYLRSLSLSPGNEQTLYWGSQGMNEPGSRNWMGMNSPAAEAMIAGMLSAADPAEFDARVEALDRVLTSGRYVIPIWYSDVSRLAYAKGLRHPDRLPIYGDWPGWQPDVWWFEQ